MASKESDRIRKTLVNEVLKFNFPIEKLRLDWEELALSIQQLPNITIEEKEIDHIHTEWIYETDSKSKDIILYFHGGGYCMGSCLTHRDLASKIAIATKRTVVLFNYSLAPESLFPKAIEESEKVYHWIKKNYTKSKHIVFGGDSSGGGLALTTCMSLINKNLSLPQAMFLISPWVDLTCSGESYSTKTDLDPILSKEVMIQYAKTYLGSNIVASPLATPLTMDVHKLPPLLIQVGYDEILLSDALRLADKAKSSGVNVDIRVWDNMWHVWHAYGLPESEIAIKRIDTFIREQE